MGNLPPWVAKVTAAWVAIGTLLVVIGAQGVALPEQVTAIFSQEFVDATMQVVGAVLAYYQFVRGIFATKEPAGEVQILTAGKKRAFALNPFKLSVH